MSEHRVQGVQRRASRKVSTHGIFNIVERHACVAIAGAREKYHWYIVRIVVVVVVIDDDESESSSASRGDALGRDNVDVFASTLIVLNLLVSGGHTLGGVRWDVHPTINSRIGVVIIIIVVFNALRACTHAHHERLAAPRSLAIEERLDPSSTLDIEPMHVDGVIITIIRRRVYVSFNPSHAFVIVVVVVVVRRRHASTPSVEKCRLISLNLAISLTAERDARATEG